MIIKINDAVTMVSDYESPDMAEQPVTINNMQASEGIELTDYGGHYVFMPYRMIDQVCKAMKEFKPKKK